MSAWYNEIDPLKAEVLRQAIAAGAIADGDVDERSVADVKPAELMGYTQCHFFAGGGFWSLALRWAGWPDDRPVWTGSNPCQPFSDAGKGIGFADERHLWPFWHHHIRVCRPATVFGEQVSSKDGLAWLDLVQADMEGLDYALGPVVTPAAGYGAPHGRHRQYWVAHPSRGGERARLRNNGKDGFGWIIAANGSRSGMFLGTGNSIEAKHLGEPKCSGLERYAGDGNESYESGRIGEVKNGSTASAGAISCVGDAEGIGWKWRKNDRHQGGRERSSGQAKQAECVADNHQDGCFAPRDARSELPKCHAEPCSAVNGFWKDAEWIPCRNPKIPGAIEWRPIKPGTFCLANGSASRVGELHLYGDGIVIAQAQAFIEAYMSL